MSTEIYAAVKIMLIPTLSNAVLTKDALKMLLRLSCRVPVLQKGMKHDPVAAELIEPYY